jgi:uncharacterized SAM-binding protein YcdF (DUF218 family)
VLASGNSQRIQSLLVGAVLGGLAAILLLVLGVQSVLRIPSLATLALGACVGTVLAAFRLERWLLAADIALVALYLVIFATPIINQQAGRWARSDAIPDGALDAIVVLSSGVTSDTVLEAAGTSRLLTGLELYNRGLAARLVTTEVRTRGLSSITDQQRLVRLASAESAWVSLPLVGSTREEADRAADLLSERRIGPRVAVVTSPMHTRRACALFERRGFAVVCVPARERDHDRWHPRTGADRVHAFRSYVHERLGWWYYRLKGWL